MFDNHKLSEAIQILLLVPLLLLLCLNLTYTPKTHKTRVVCSGYSTSKQIAGRTQIFVIFVFIGFFLKKHRAREGTILERASDTGSNYDE